jgi:hypothetical protein
MKGMHHKGIHYNSETKIDQLTPSEKEVCARHMLRPEQGLSKALFLKRKERNKYTLHEYNSNDVFELNYNDI